MGEVVTSVPKSCPDCQVEGRTTARSNVRYQIYVSAVVLIPLLFLLTSIPIVRSASFPAQSGDPFLLNPDYAFSLKHVDCEVVIFGDSTAVTGVDPLTVGGVTRLKICNIGQSRSALEILGTLALDTYLTNNAPPKYIVMQFAPETLARGSQDLFWPEGLTLLLRKKPIPYALLVLARHPVESYGFALWAIKAKIGTLFRSSADFSATEAIFQSRGGLLVLPKPPETRCIKRPSYQPPRASWVRMLRDRYSGSATKVLINVSPIPTCTPDAAGIAAGNRNVTDNSLALYPIGLFNDLDRHLTFEGAQRLSLEIGDEILSREHQGH